MSYISNTFEDQQKMLQNIGLNSLEELFADIPAHLILKNQLDLPPALSEMELKDELTQIAKKNVPSSSFLGCGSYAHYVPATVRAMLSRSEFYTAYTPYQPEISQGTLQAIFEYQSMICELTGMDVSNASLYDGATSLAEAMFMAVKIKGKNTVLVAKTIHPLYRQVLQTYANANSIKIIEVNYEDGKVSLPDLQNKLSADVAAFLVQSPNIFGCLEDLTAARELSQSVLLISSTTEALSWAMLKPFAQYGVDIVTGEGQSFGNAQNFGGPGLGIMAVKSEYMRQMPGRIIGQTVDTEGQRGFVLTLSAREQHIRREKATSNICSNEGLCALGAAIYLATLGKQLQKLAELNHKRAVYFQQELSKIKGIEIPFQQPFFNEFTIKIVPELATKLAANQIELGVDLGCYYPELANHLVVCCTEMTSHEAMQKVLKIIA